MARGVAQKCRGSQIWHLTDAGEETLLRLPLRSKVGSNVLVRERRAEHEEALAIVQMGSLLWPRRSAMFAVCRASCHPFAHRR